MGLVPDDMKQTINSGLVLKAAISTNDIRRALKGRTSVRDLLTWDGRLKCDLGEIPKEATLHATNSGADIHSSLQAWLRSNTLPDPE